MSIKENAFNVYEVSPLDPCEPNTKLLAYSSNRDINAELLDKIGGLKNLKEYEAIVAGARAGMTAYLKPQDGIPLVDLSKDLLVFVLNVTRLLDEILNGLTQDCGIVDTTLNINSNNAIANSEVTKNFNRLEELIPHFSIEGETLKFN